MGLSHRKICPPAAVKYQQCLRQNVLFYINVCYVLDFVGFDAVGWAAGRASGL